ncbi:MAG: aldolase/citrate lyase family protein [Chloroflexi bacterium]|nr:aldolase/citrate lyase family protein [Chloroflexota bacterium]MDA1239756.1 aldolase/citrate lyase family protein [Chloroflexota bacterium]MQC47673.1 hypothetical protein [Chloroflexota bacterium]
MRINTTRQKMEAGEVVLGGLVGDFSPDLVELLGALGYDFAFLDCEHGNMSLEQVENMVRACETYGVTPIARIPDHADSTILRYLDRGVQGIIVPHVNTADEARSIALAARFQPRGHRGASGGRPHGYNVELGRDQSMKFINDQLLVIPMCEEVEAVTNLEDILAVDGIDMVHCAANDLGQSMGYPGDAEVRRVMLDVVKRVRAAGKFAGAGGNSPRDPDGVVEFINAGAQFITVPALGLFRVAAEGFRDHVRGAIKAS